MAEESKFITRKEKEEKKSGPYITKKKKKIDLGEVMSKALSNDERTFITKKDSDKKEKSGPYITRKNTTDKETVGDAQKRGKIDLGKVINFKKGGRVKKRNTRRMNRLEELGRVDAEKAFTKKGKKNLKAEKKRIVRELKSSGGSAGAAIRGKGCEIR
tara:strand:+ start:356 stop:829 length:474 start_codon:yes stop_codon:yes gene_type:complete